MRYISKFPYLILFFLIAIFITSNLISNEIERDMSMKSMDLDSKDYINSLPQGFVYLDQINDKIISNLMYNTEFNFVGEKIDGYYINRVILTKEAAGQLNKAWTSLDSQGYNIVIYDAYRPQKAVDHFKRWAKDNQYSNSEMKKYFFPRISHSEAFSKNYIAEKSGHSRGSTVDISIIKKGDKLIPFSKSDSFETTSVQLQGKDKDIKIYNLNDGTLDMGTSVDLMDEASSPTSKLVSELAQKNRKILRDAMEKAGFEVYKTEWWHFTLKNESNKDVYYNFDIKDYDKIRSD